MPATAAKALDALSHSLLQATWYEIQSGRAFLKRKEYGRVSASAFCMEGASFAGQGHAPLKAHAAPTEGDQLFFSCRPILLSLFLQALKRFLKVDSHIAANCHQMLANPPSPLNSPPLCRRSSAS